MNWKKLALFFPTFETKREKVAFGIAIGILFVLAFLSEPKRSVVNGRKVVEAVIFGNVFPMWVVWPIGIFLLIVLYGLANMLMLRLSRKTATKPDPTAQDFEYEKLYLPKTGSFTAVAWQPQVPGGESPFDYEPTTFTSDMTAREFLTAEEPNAIRVTVIGDDWYNELHQFVDGQLHWYRTTSEQNLRDLIPELERIGRQFDEGFLYLMAANRERGIPSREEIAALAERMNHEGLRKMLKGEEWDPFRDRIEQSANNTRNPGS